MTLTYICWVNNGAIAPNMLRQTVFAAIALAAYSTLERRKYALARDLAAGEVVDLLYVHQIV